MSNEFNVVCGKCKSEIAIIADVHGELAMCVVCGQRDNLDEAHRVAAEHFMYGAIPEMQKGLSDAFKSELADSLAQRAFRWHAVPLS
jgi:hypothetical protein